MEDLRTDEQKQKDEKVWTGREVNMYTGHIPSFWTKLKKFIKKIIKPILIIGIILLTLFYPNEIGSFLGNWAFEFWTGITNKF